MENRIPVPTDNIFKFYALFGLLLVVFSLGSSIYIIRSSNELIFSTLPELAALKQITNPTDVDRVRIAVLERKMEISKTDKLFDSLALGFPLALGAFGIWHGFRKWHKEVQPVLDETAKVNLKIAKLQLEKLRRELGKAPAP